MLDFLIYCLCQILLKVCFMSVSESEMFIIRPSLRRTLTYLILLVLTPHQSLVVGTQYAGNHPECRTFCSAVVDRDKYQVC